MTRKSRFHSNPLKIPFHFSHCCLQQALGRNDSLLFHCTIQHREWRDLSGPLVQLSWNSSIPNKQRSFSICCKISVMVTCYLSPEAPTIKGTLSYKSKNVPPWKVHSLIPSWTFWGQKRINQVITVLDHVPYIPSLLQIKCCQFLQKFLEQDDNPLSILVTLLWTTVSILSMFCLGCGTQIAAIQYILNCSRKAATYIWDATSCISMI